MEDNYEENLLNTAATKFMWESGFEDALGDLDPMSHDIWQKPMEGAMSFDVGEGKDYSVVTLFDGVEYRPIALCDAISFGSDVAHSGYVGVDVGELSFSAEVVDVNYGVLGALFGLDYLRDMTSKLLGYRVDSCGKVRKTTYKTIRRDCAKRNRHK